MMASKLIFFLLVWTVTIASIWTYFEDYFNDDV